MSIDARLNKLMPALTARERAILVLKAYRDNTPEDPSWRRTLPDAQRDEFNRLIGLMNACNKHLPLFITMVEGWAEQMQLRVCWWETMVGYGSALWHLGQFVPVAKRRQAEAAVDKYRPFVELPWDSRANERSWLDMADGMEDVTWQCVAHLWDNLMAIDTVIAEVAAQFNGEDPLGPVMRGVLEKARWTLSLLHRFLSGDEAIEVTEPSEDALALARIYFEKGLN